MKGASTVEEASLALDVKRVAINVDAFIARVRDQLDERMRRAKEQAAAVEKPAVGVVGVGSVDEVKSQAALDLSGIALKEILNLADSGTATVTIPLLPQSFKAGPVTIDLVAGTLLDLDVTVQPGGVIDRSRTRGRLAPALKLPLGATVDGVYLDDKGDITADLNGLPDINLSFFALGGFQVPPTLPELVDVLFADRPPSDGPAVVDTGGIAVVAKQVGARDVTLQLGPSVSLVLGSTTLLDVHYGEGHVKIEGALDVKHAVIQQAAYDVKDVGGRCTVRADVALDGSGTMVALDELDVDIAHAHAALGGNEVTLAALHTTGASVVVDTVSNHFMVRFPDVAGRVLDGCAQLHIGAAVLPLRLQPGAVSGSVMVSDKHHQLDLVVEDLGVAIVDARVPVGVASLGLRRADVQGSGRLRVASDGVALSGRFGIHVVTGETSVEAPPLKLRSERGEGQIVLTELAVGAGALELLHLEGGLELTLAGGSVPLFGKRLELTPGARAVASVDEVHVELGHTPRASGSLRVEAKGDEVVVDDALLTVPASRALVEVHRVLLSDGVLSLEGVHAGLKVLPESGD